MKIIELMNILSKINDKHGNLPVVIEDCDTGWYLILQGLEVIEPKDMLDSFFKPKSDCVSLSSNYSADFTEGELYE